MPRRFLNVTETTLVSLVKKVMKRHKPYEPGLKRAFVNFVRSFSVGSKPSDAHSLSVLVTEDLLVEVVDKFDSADISSAFVNVMSLADEEVINHYSHPNRSPFFASILKALLKEFKARSDYYLNEWDLSFFARFVAGYLERNGHDLSNEELNQALEILVSPRHYRLLSVNWLLLRFIAAGYVEVARGARGVAQGFTTPNSSQTGNSFSDVFTSRYNRGADGESETADAVHNSDALSHMRTHTTHGQERFDVLFALPEAASLKYMLEDEVEAMMSLYSLVLFCPYIDEEYQISERAFAEARPAIAWTLKQCVALLGRIGSASMVFYMGSMVGSLIAQMSGETGSVSNAEQTPCLSQSIMKMIENLAKIIVNKSEESVKEQIRTLPEIIGNISAPTLSNYSAMPASISLLMVMYLSVPIVMFGGYASKWISNKIESRSGARFVNPKLLSPIVVTQGFRLVANTLLAGTPHISEAGTIELLNWTIKRLYFPLSLTGQPAKTTGFLNSALAASPTNRHRQVELSTKTCVIATVAALPFEYGIHAMSSYEKLAGEKSLPVTRFAMFCSMVSKSARIFALFGPSYHARKYNPDNYAYSSYFEQMLWIDGAKAITAPAILIGFDLATTPFASTVVMTLDSLVSFIPDIMLGIKYSMLNKTASKLTALNAWLYRNNLSSQEVLKLATMATLEDVPGAAKASLMYMMEKRLKKNIVQDLGMDLIIDEGRSSNEQSEEAAEEETHLFSPAREATRNAMGDNEPENTHIGRDTRLSSKQRRAVNVELQDVKAGKHVKRKPEHEAYEEEAIILLPEGVTLGDWEAYKPASHANQQKRGIFSSLGKVFEGAKALSRQEDKGQSRSKQHGRIYRGAHSIAEEEHRNDSSGLLIVPSYASSVDPTSMHRNRISDSTSDIFMSSTTGASAVSSPNKQGYRQESATLSTKPRSEKGKKEDKGRRCQPNNSLGLTDSTSDIFMSSTGAIMDHSCASNGNRVLFAKGSNYYEDSGSSGEEELDNADFISNASEEGGHCIDADDGLIITSDGSIVMDGMNEFGTGRSVGTHLSGIRAQCSAGRKEVSRSSPSYAQHVDTLEAARRENQQRNGRGGLK